VKSAIKFAIKETPARLKLADAIDQRNTSQEKLRRTADSSERSAIESRIHNIEADIRLAVIDVLGEEAEQAVSKLGTVAHALAHQVGATIRLLDDFSAITQASGLAHGKLQHTYAAHVTLNDRIDEVVKKLFADLNMAAAEAAAAKFVGSTGHASPLANLAKALVDNPTATLEA